MLALSRVLADICSFSTVFLVSYHRSKGNRGERWRLYVELDDHPRVVVPGRTFGVVRLSGTVARGC